MREALAQKKEVIDRSATVNHNHLCQYMVNFNPIGRLRIILSGDNLT